MGKYIQQSKGYKGSIRVRIITKKCGKTLKVEHIGVSHNEKELKMFLALAQERLRDKNQQEFKFSEFEEEKPAGITHKKSYSKFLYDTLAKIYDKLQIKELSDEIFEQITLARIIQPASKLDTIEILDDLGLEYPLKDAISLFKTRNKARLSAQNIRWFYTICKDKTSKYIALRCNDIIF
jgi:hypothetical protein